MRNALLAIVLCASLPAPPVSAQAPVPEARIYHSMVPVSESDVLVLGGVTRHGWTMDLHDVWRFRPRAMTWARAGDLEPGDVFAAAFDRQSSRVIALALDGETWAMDPRTGGWERMSPESAPSGRCGHRLAYDSQSDRVILFGGFPCTAVEDPMAGDTWAYDYEADRWEERRPETSPAPRIYHAMAYHPGLDRTVVWGGRVADGSVWSYDYESDSWRQHDIQGGPGGIRAYQTLTPEPTSGALLAFGGLELDGARSFGGTLRNDTWLLDLDAGTWRRLDPVVSPTPRSHHAAVLDPGADQVLVHGGEVGSAYSERMTGETWWFDYERMTWSRTRDSLAFRTEDVLTPDGVRLHTRLLGSGPDTVMIGAAAWLAEDLAPLAPGRTLIFWDPPSRGGSEAVDADRLGMEQEAADIEAVRAHYGIDRFSLVGWSYGGAVAALYAARFPAHLRGVVMIGPMAPRRASATPLSNEPRGSEPDPADLALLESLRRDGVPERDPRHYCRAVLRVRWIQPMMRRPETAAAMRADPCAYPNEWPERLLATGRSFLPPLTGEDWDYSDAARSVETPVLIVQGTADPNAAVEGARDWSALLPDARRVELDGVGHAPWLEAPNEFFTAVDAFLRTVGGGGPGS